MHTETDKTDARWGEVSSLHDPSLLANFKAQETEVLIRSKLNDFIEVVVAAAGRKREKHTV